MSSSSENKFKINEKVLCYHGPFLYEAKCLKISKNEEAKEEDSEVLYFLHYMGWNKNWDEWISEAKLLKRTPENLRKMRELSKNSATSKMKKPSDVNQASKKKQSKTKQMSGDNRSEAGRSSSRVSTPESDMSLRSSKRTLTDDERSTSAEDESVFYSGGKPSPKSPEELISSTSPREKSYPKSPEEPIPSTSRRKSRSKSPKKSVPSTGKSYPKSPEEPIPSTSRRQTHSKSPKKSVPPTSPGRKTGPKTPDEPMPSTSRGLRRTRRNIGERQSKRLNPDAEEIKKPEDDPKGWFNITIPQELKKVLVKDSDLVNDGNKIVRLPAKISGSKVLSDFLANLEESNFKDFKIAEEITKGIEEVFNRYVQADLLYEVERIPYTNIIEENSSKNPIDIYGSVHLLRLMVKMNDYLNSAHIIKQTDVEFIGSILTMFLKFLEERISKYFSISNYSERA